MAVRPRLLLLHSALTVVAATGGAFGGFHVGQALHGTAAGLLDAHWFDPKELMLASAFSGAALGAATGIWLALVLAQAGEVWQRGAQLLFGLAVFGSIMMIAAAYHWPTSGGPPLVQYELRLPPGSPLPQLSEIAITVWSERNGNGAYIARIRRIGERPEIVGDMVIPLDNHSPTVSLRLRNADGIAEGYWRLPYRPGSPLESEFGPWQRITFIPSPQPDVGPMPAGDYDIRYRVRRHLRTY